MKTLTTFALAVALAAAQSAEKLPDYRALKYPPLRQVDLPKIEPVTLPNGMKLYLLEYKELPLISGFALVRTGNLFEPADRIGLAGMTGTVMRTGGTKTKTGDQLDIELENVAASVESSIGETSGRVGFSCLRENVDQVLAAFRDVLTSPEFRQEKIDLAKTQARSALARRNDDAGSILSREFASILYGRDNPYGWEMKRQHIDAITREDMLAFHRRYFFPKNILMAVSGDFNAAEMRARIEKLFADWSPEQPAVPPFPKVTAPANAQGIYFAEKSDVTQTSFEIGHLGGVLRDPDYPALAVMSDILGGGFASRLTVNVRTKLGYVYSIGGGWGANYNHPGLFAISGATPSARTVDTIKAALAEVERIRTAEVTDQELDTAKNSVLNSFVFNFVQPAQTLSRIVTYDYYGYPRDFIFQYQKGIAAVTKADVLRVAREYLKPERFTTVAVGRSADFGSPLSTLGEVKTLALDDEPPPAPPAKPATSDAARRLLDRALEAVGGREGIGSEKDITITGDVKMSTDQGELAMKQTVYIIRPAELRGEQELPFGKVVIYYDGKGGGWIVSPQGAMPSLPEPVVQQIRGQFFRSMPEVLLAPERGATVEAVGDNAVRIRDQAGNDTRITFDAKTGLPASQTYTADMMGQGPQETTDVYSEWREVNGVKMPFKVRSERGGEPVMQTTITDAKVNTGLKSADLAKQPD